jgi:signal transduction histidine kinase
MKLLSTAALLTLLGVAVPTVLSIGPLLDRWLALLMLAGFGWLTTRLPDGEEAPRLQQVSTWQQVSLILGIQSALLVALFVLFPQSNALIFLFYILSVETLLYFPVKTGLLWLLGYIITATVFLLRISAAGEILSNMASLVGGLLLFGLISSSLRNARLAQKRSDSLLAELQVANRQLQVYADQVETLSIHAERNRLAREMHDTIGHHLTVASVQLEAAHKLALSDPERTAGLAVTAQQQVREALNELRQIVSRLHEPLETDLQLPQALSRLVESFRQSGELTVHLALPDKELQLPDAHRLVLYRAAQEGLTNIQRHAGATQAWLRLERAPGSIDLHLQDNGIGLPEGFSLLSERATAAGGFGLRGMYERVTQLGGEISLQNQPQGGANLHVRLPLPEKNQHV